MLNDRLAGDHLYGKKLFTWLSLVMASFCAVIFPRDVLDEIWDLVGSVSKGFPTYSYNFGTMITLLYRTGKSLCSCCIC